MNHMSKLETPDVTTKQTIYNPKNADHFMHIQPVNALVEVFIADELIASTAKAMWLQETGKTIYVPRLYLPVADLRQELEPMEKQTHCPLKGDASYFSYLGKEVAWRYAAPLEFASIIQGLISFLPNTVRVEIGV